MQKFILTHKLLAVEEKAFKDRCCTLLDLSETQYWNRWRGRTALSAAESMAMAQVLEELREEVEDGVLDLIMYNTK